MPRRKLDPKQRLRLRALKRAEKIGMTAAAKESGISRVMLHRWRDRFEAEGIEGLRDRSHRPHHHPHTTPAEVAEQVVEVALLHPTHGCRRLVGALSERGISISEPTVQGILVDRELGLAEQRVGMVERRILSGACKPSTELLAEVEAADPAFRERTRPIPRPGSLLITDIIRGGIIEEGRRLRVVVVVDAGSAYAWAMPFTDIEELPHIEILRGQVMPDLEEWGVKPFSILTPNRASWAEDSPEGRAFRMWCREVFHLRQKFQPEGVRNGNVEGYHRVFQSWFRREGLHRAPILQVEQDITGWLEERNRETRWMYPSFGRSAYNMMATTEHRRPV